MFDAIMGAAMDTLLALGVVAGCLVILVVGLFGLGLIRVLTVQEATAVVFKYMGRFAYCAMEFANHHMEPDGSIYENGDPNHPGPGANSAGSCWCIWRIGGWVFYLAPFVAPAKYSDHNDDNFGENYLVHLNDRTTQLVVLDQKTVKPENVGLDVEFVGIERICNPIWWLFRSPMNAKAQIDERIITALRLWIAKHKQEFIQQSKGNGPELWTELVDHLGFGSKVADARAWGLEIVKDSLAPEKVKYSSAEFAAALEARAQAALLATAKAAELGGPVENMMNDWVAKEAKRLHVSVKKAVADLKASGAYDRKEQYFEKLRAQGLAADAGNFSIDERESASTIDISSGGKAIADPEFKTLAIVAGAVTAAMQQIKQGGPKQGRPKQGGPKPMKTGNGAGNQSGGQSGGQGDPGTSQGGGQEPIPPAPDMQ